VPWHIEDDNADCSGYAVVKDSDGEIEGCHETKADAEDQLAALYANERSTLVKPRIRHFRGRIVTPVERLRAALDDTNATVAEAEAVVAVFDVPDTYVAVGNSARQVIDKGAFRSWIRARDFGANPVPFFVDHGEDGPVLGLTSDRLRIGKCTGFTEEDDGVHVQLQWNLRTMEGREAAERMAFDPSNAQFSFSNAPNEKIYRGKDGYEHIEEFPDGMDEVSQVAFGAQKDTHLASAVTMRGRGGIARAISLDEQPNDIRDAWYRLNANDWNTYVADVYADDDQREAGFIVAWQDSSYWQVPWTQDAKGAITFDVEARSEVEQTWVKVGKKTSLRTAAAIVAMFPADAFADAVTPLVASRLRAGADAALQSERDLFELYAAPLLDGRTSAS
jgi:phage head maturation protease